MDWQNIDTVLLDMDGTLLDLHYDNYFWLQYLPRLYGEMRHLSEDQARQKLLPLFKKYQGSLNWYSVNFWSQQLNLNIMEHKRVVAYKVAFRPKAEHFLRGCRQKVADLRLITNAHREVYELKHSITGLGQYFDVVSCSHELGYPKENHQYWQVLMNHQSFDREKTVFIDDSEAVLDSASAFGVKHIYSIKQPDSQKNTLRESKYPMLDCLMDLF